MRDVARVSPAEVAVALGQFPPTDEQSEIIAAPRGPLLVVAGAGAGKTETMAARVVWMVANGLVRPEEVLGLTFTRKAAQQLTTRIRQRLARLAGSDLLRRLDASGELRRTVLSGEPEVSTYHSYAGRLLQRHGMVLPLEPSTTLVSETELWQLAHRVVAAWDGDVPLDRAPASITESVLALSGQLAEHLVEPGDPGEAHTELEKLIHHLPPGPKQKSGGPTKDLLGILQVQEHRLDLLPLVARLHEVMTRDGLLDFGRQMSLAARVAADHPDVGRDERTRCRLVLLDEYQDTGHAQRVLLSSLFGGGRDATLTVTAVGDPMQSIYGWRGASAANLPRFGTDFPRSARYPAPVRQLSTSWRNPPEALALANAVAAPLRMRGVAVDELRARPGAVPGDVRLALTTTVDDERRWIAEAIAREYRTAREDGRTPPTAAVLVRRNADAGPMAEVLRGAGLPVEVVGLGGLLRTPEVADLVAMLRLVSDPLAGSAAMRVLTGSRWQLGAADLRALWRRAREIAAHTGRGRTGTVTDAEELGRALEDGMPGERSEQSGLVDALADPGDPSRYSEAGHRRILALGGELQSLRHRLGQPLPDLVADVERVLGIDVEAGARRPSGDAGGREHLDAFAEVVAEYGDQQTATLTGLLSFLSAAESVEDGLAPGEVDVDPHRVQVLTVHSAKGLEWEVVAVPHVCESVFPSTRSSASWLGSVAELPPSLRGDRAIPGDDAGGVPVLDLEGATHRGDIADAVTEHKAALARRRLDEDRRLFYVALTRTERVLLVSAHHWAPGASSPKGPSSFLAELHGLVETTSAIGGAEIGTVQHWEPTPPDGADNPYATVELTALWPADPLGARREDVIMGSAAVRAALVESASVEESSSENPDDDDPDGWARDVELLLAERDAVSRPETDVVVPDTMSVSQVVHLVADPDALASTLRRPVPFAPNPLARRGTAFHAWVERRFGATRLLDLDELPGAADGASAADTDLEELQRAFDASPWALRSPVELEVPFETSVGGVVLRGRMDAVFADSDGGWTVVDWKTGAQPTPAEERAVAIQLAAYRLAWAELMSATRSEPVPLTTVRAAFHYVRSGVTVSPTDLPDAERLAEIISTAGADPAT
ncbi:ATP-dependent helicase [Rhodococcus sp. BP-241]|uniref:ATP-dependent helicase n=1 Tax=Rhodococcus sp. BP-241 TaxID=2739441 RepID=UPI001C9BBC72|nr:ATP-dependent DNA helicase [Rhodococcus sp. BP-241]MBY6708199.1 ATP-dependent helicase [Rhodococcus sp. BP-241]